MWLNRNADSTFSLEDVPPVFLILTKDTCYDRILSLFIIYSPTPYLGINPWEQGSCLLNPYSASTTVAGTQQDAHK